MIEHRGEFEFPDDGEALGPFVVEVDTVRQTGGELMSNAPEQIAGLGTIAVSEEGSPINTGLAV